ncbi:MAG: Hsp20/alpha crystallin family protein [Phycisphaerales bacterium]|nr:MAG: Hsp20/alpha crystallin family protein [Phycisphaerales bacterium]
MDDAFRKMADQFGSMIDDMLGGKSFRSSAPDSWDPALNVYELDDRYVVCVELAGMDCEKIDVYVEERVLHIRGARAKPAVPDASGPVSVHLMEIDSGRFHRKVPIASDVRVAGVHAVYRKGYVWIDLPREPKISAG